MPTQLDNYFTELKHITVVYSAGLARIAMFSDTGIVALILYKTLVSSLVEKFALLVALLA